MKIDEIQGVSREEIKVIIGEKVLLIKGELTTDKFYADRSSIKTWEAPFDKQEITKIEKDEIVAAVESSTKKADIPIIFQ